LVEKRSNRPDGTANLDSPLNKELDVEERPPKGQCSTQVHDVRPIG